MTTQVIRQRRGGRQATIILLLMLSSATLAWLLIPRHSMAELNRHLALQTAIPTSFGGWKSMPSNHQSIVDPQQRVLLDALYSQTLSRTYVNSLGDRIMLSIAYGESQAGEIEMHRPEVCYVAQGFTLKSVGSAELAYSPTDRPLPLQRLMARAGDRLEPITYWMRVGDKVVASGSQQQIARVSQGLSGWIVDGILVRVSSLTEQNEAAYKLHEQFMQDLLQSVDSETRKFLIGPVTSVNKGKS